jgi:hypothetical protein
VYATGSYWFGAAPMAAALTTLKRVRETDYLEHTQCVGTQLRVAHDVNDVLVPQIVLNGTRINALIWLVEHRELRTSRRVRTVFDFLAAELS